MRPCYQVRLTRPCIGKPEHGGSAAAQNGRMIPVMSKLEEIEAIKQLKYRYLRCLDTKKWAELSETFTEDAQAAYDSGKYTYDGRDAIMKFLEESLGDASIVSRHQGHHPEIEIRDDGTARGTWYLEDYVIFGGMGAELSGAAFYEDEYVKVDGEWKIRTTGYARTYEQFSGRDGVQQLRTMFQQPEKADAAK